MAGAKITFWGAAGQVTGSMHLLEAAGARILLDAGLFQGHRAEAAALNANLPFDPRRIDAIVVSHAHMDHIGRLPLLVRHGYHGPIHMLVGLDMTGELTGVVVTYNSEPYGYFSVEPPKFAMQFKGTKITDPFRVGGDVDAVSRASISIASETRAIRDSARMAAKQLLSEAGKQ